MNEEKFPESLIKYLINPCRGCGAEKNEHCVGNNSVWVHVERFDDFKPEPVLTMQSVQKMTASLNEMSDQFIKFSLAYNDLITQIGALKAAHPELFEKDN